MNNANHKDMEENQATKDKRAAIREIMAITTLNAQEKQLRIQALMSNSNENSNEASASNKRKEEEGFILCSHYERECEVVAPCCNQVYSCRLCHDNVEDHTLPRFEIEEVVCRKCGERQLASNQCSNRECGVEFATYYCSVCHLWIGGEGAKTKKPFHCEKCGICRVGGRENFTHCDECCMCIRNDLSEHHCIKDKYKNMCPVCREDMFSSRQSPIELACGHCIHNKCFQTLAQFDYRCPICKKTACDEVVMEEEWASRARDIQMQPMPANLCRIVSIICNDCTGKTAGLTWHFLGVQCPSCRSFNTSILSIDRNSGRSSTTSTSETMGDIELNENVAEALSQNSGVNRRSERGTASISNPDGEQHDTTINESPRQDDMDTRL